ncbi:MAG TPA: DUF2330 domain-containing protein [Bacteroidia bacterium]|nr:DUF2330 domain-containing protein [Bacteroidia bacterium]
MKTTISKSLVLALLLLMGTNQVNAFCGFYVAKADAKLFNKSSQVIIARDGSHTVITMSSDFQGDAKDFAMVVPVPEVLKESDIRVVQQYIFDKFDAFTAPRLVEYWDENPCQERYTMENVRPAAAMSKRESKSMAMDDAEADLGVTIEAKYTVGEYDILILSATQSTGLKTWLTGNGYKIPSGADEVLDPYIKDGMKFFVVKVNLEQQKALGVQTLRPLQIQFNSSRFMLPIRLGMANAESAQDMIVYAFTRKGRVETANYRTTKLPTDRDIPEFVLNEGLFGEFYKALYEKAWTQEGKNSVMLEYAWDESSQQSVHCDPCVTSPLSFAEVREAGVWWVQPDPGDGGYDGDLFITRLHVRYARTTFPQDLMFINTPDQSNFQGRYVIRHAATGPLDCAEGKRYKGDLRMRRQKELQELAALTGWNVGKWGSYLGESSIPDPVIPVLPMVRDSNLPQSTLPVGLTTPAVKVPKVNRAGFIVQDDTATGIVGNDSGLVNQSESIAASNQFLKAATEKGKPRFGRTTWLMALAGLMFIGGMAVRLVGRKSKPNA